MDIRYFKLNDIEAYKVAFNLSNYVWDVVNNWDYFSKETVGKQFVNAIDLISSNIAEGSGRFIKRDKIRFYRISIGSLKESLDWHKKSKVRNLLSAEQYQFIFEIPEKLPKLIKQLI